ncbi:MAG: phosphonate metabolism protein/1,5-bisphosphokinase (PRPP-forming) PhnN [Gammaproteobacteria bacterium]|nr:phosphonate metabolism protein/1,5-bisphosphokinase (PRPP-forming) PhnN [Gammaproteobacteria bacterium]
MTKLFYVMGPSGAGKDTVLRGARQHHSIAAYNAKDSNPLVFAHRYITRPADASGAEVHVPLTHDEFASRVALGSFAMHWQSHGNHYGLGVEIHHWLAAGAHVVVNGSRAYLECAQNAVPSLVPILITAPSAMLAARIKDRSRESESAVAARLARAMQFDSVTPADVVVNDGTASAAIEAFCAMLLAHCGGAR